MSSDRDAPMSTGAWFLTLLVLAIPLVNVIMYLVWALGVGNRNTLSFFAAGTDAETEITAHHVDFFEHFEAVPHHCRILDHGTDLSFLDEISFRDAKPVECEVAAADGRKQLHWIERITA